MGVSSHKDYKKEKERLDYTKEYLNTTIAAIEEYKSNTLGNMQQDLMDMDMTDNSSSYINMILNSQVMDFAEKNYYGYKRALVKPYFARVDFKRNGEDKVQKIYIGKTSLMRAEDNELLIVDWRAPVSSIYYDGRLGEVEYESEDGIEKGELLLKRQLSIEEGNLKSILDIDITATDEFLQASLSANAESRLKDIASTIQAEQNKVIRADLNKPIIIQGVAGSGKTTIALHRIAYFMYTYEKTFNPENFLIIAPNNLFINYISDVLPELGVENVRQNTYVDFMKILLEAKPKVKSKDETLASIVSGSSKDIENKVWISRFKGSEEFINIINNYIREVELDFPPNEDFEVRGKMLMSKEEINKMFYEDLNIYSLHKRIKELQKSLKNKLNMVDKDLIKRLEFSYDFAINRERKTPGDAEKRRLKVVKLINERDEALKNAEDEIKNAVKNYGLKFKSESLWDYYSDIFKEENLIRLSNGSLTKKHAKLLSKDFKENFTPKKMELEDLAPLVYLKHRIFGFTKPTNVRSVVIDEAQDFSIFEFFALKEVLGTSMFTLLGDMSQGIYSYRAFKLWEEVIEKVFKDDKPSYMTLVQSYRTTIEVMNLANKVIESLNRKELPLAKPVIRHGEKPEYREYTNEDIILENLVESLKKRKKESYKSIAVICKTLKECKNLKKKLDEIGKIESRVLNEKEMEYEAGVIILPCYLAKGLEFDCVFIVNIEEEYTEEELETKLLYVAMTRTLHRLHIYSMENKIPLLNKINNNDLIL